MKVLKGGDVVDGVRELIAIKKHITAEQQRNEEEEKEKKATSDGTKKSTYRHGEPFTGTIPFDLTWTTPNIKKNKVSGSLESYQPFIPPLNYKLPELIPKPHEPEVFKKWKDYNFLENSKL